MPATDRAKRLTLLAAILGSSVVFLDGTVVNVALPSIRADLESGLAEQQWIVEAYLLTLGSLILVGGSLGDILGRRRVFVWGLAGFGVTSALCAVAPGAVALIVARGLQGVAGALLVPSSLALITATFPGDERGGAIGSWTAWTGMAFVIGPLGGGLLIEFASWRWIFAINVPLVLATLWLVRAGVPESRDEQASRSIDYLGALLASLGLAGPVFALIEQPRYGWADPLVWVPLVGGLALLALFLWHERRTAHPMLPLTLFRSRNFAIGNLSTLLVYGGLGAMSFFVVIFLQQVAGYSPVAAGLALLPITLLMWVLSRRFGALSDRIGPRLPMGLGPIVAGLGMLWLARLDADVNYVTEVLPGVLVFGLGLSATVAPLTNTVLGAVPQHNAGVASGVNNQIARVAALLAIAAVGAVIASTFSSELGPPAPIGDYEPLTGRGIDGVEDASVTAFRAGMIVSGGFVILGGLISLAGIVNPRREEERPVHDEPGAIRVAQPCPEGRRAA
ncbi:MAG TPA: MFS transporter [Solirubrobacteraceae bacterium]|nr:MFS transporter [Solirubrobacteraceae bacterium]